MILGAMLLAGMVNAADPAGTVNWNEQNVWKSTKIKAGTDEIGRASCRERV